MCMCVCVCGWVGGYVHMCVICVGVSMHMNVLC